MVLALVAADMLLYIIVHLPELGQKAATSQFIAWIYWKIVCMSYFHFHFMSQNSAHINKWKFANFSCHSSL